MARNGSGTYSRVSGTPYVYGTVIDQVVVNAEMNDIATALTNSLAKDGQTTPTANLPMGGFKITGLAAASLSGDAVNLGQLTDSSAMPAGSVIQVVSATYSTATSNSTTTYADTGLTATITPKYSTSKILVLINHSMCHKSAADAASGLSLKIFRNAVDLGLKIGALGFTNAASTLYFPCILSYEDSPATTSALAYKTQFKNEVNAASVNVQSSGLPSTIHLLEIKQ